MSTVAGGNGGTRPDAMGIFRPDWNGLSCLGNRAIVEREKPGVRWDAMGRVSRAFSRV